MTLRKRNVLFAARYGRMNREGSGGPMTNRYRAKPIEVEAIPVAEIIAADGASGVPEHAADDDWLIRGGDGAVYRCGPDLFAATYEAVDEESVEDEALDRRAW